jgi:hypothetical protein
VNGNKSPYSAFFVTTIIRIGNCEPTGTLYWPWLFRRVVTSVCSLDWSSITCDHRKAFLVGLNQPYSGRVTLIKSTASSCSSSENQVDVLITILRFLRIDHHSSNTYVPKFILFPILVVYDHWKSIYEKQNIRYAKFITYVFALTNINHYYNCFCVIIFLNRIKSQCEFQKDILCFNWSAVGPFWFQSRVISRVRE